MDEKKVTSAPEQSGDRDQALFASIRREKQRKKRRRRSIKRPELEARVGQKETIYKKNGRNRERRCRHNKGVMVYSRRFGARIRAQAAAHYHSQKNARKRTR